MAREYLKDDSDAEILALLAGLGITGTGAVATSLKNSAHDAKESKIKKKASYKAFLDSLQEGDILLTRNTRKNSPNIVLGGKETPLRFNDTLMPVTGSAYGHASLYTGKGNVGQAQGQGEKIEGNKLKKNAMGADIKAYRPKVSDSEKIKALSFAKEAKGTPYKSGSELGEFVKDLLVTPGKDACRKVNGNMVCTNLVTKAYPDVFKKENVLHTAIEQNPKLELVSRYGKIPELTTGEKILTKAVHPALKNLKYGLLGGGLLYGGMKAHEYLTDNDEGELVKRLKRGTNGKV